MDKAAAMKYAERYAQSVKTVCDPVAVVLYGSYVNGTPNENSDIDIAVIFDGFTGDYLTLSAALYRLTCDISTTIEPIILDLANDKSDFAKTVFRTGHKVA